MNTVFTRILLLSLSFVLAFSSYAQPVGKGGPDRDKFYQQLRPYLHEFLTKELDLSKEQARMFFPIYDQMDEEVQKIGNETRDLEKEVLKNKEATDTEIEAASQAIFAQKEKEGKIELEYYDKFKEILQPRQLLKLKSAERRFTQKLLRQHRKLSKGDKHEKRK
ncbi:MAG: hypothetical protein J6C95_03450 [Muribaculaceae bacterium]|nr:hypothetical protein [Muribaculaceae bacterium]